MATILEQENDISLGEGEEIGNLDELMAPPKSEGTPEDVKEPVDPLEGLESDLDIPEKFKGKGIKDIVKSYVSLEQEYGRKNNEVGELRKLADEIIKKNLELNNGDIPAGKKSIGVDELLDDPEKAISNAVENNPKLRQLEEQLIKRNREEAKKVFEVRHPDWQDIVKDPQFQQWVFTSPMRTKMFKEADANYDYETGSEILDLYKQIHQVKVENAKAEQKSNRDKALKAATTEKGSTGQSGKKVFKRSDIMNLMIKDRDKYNSPEFQAELSRAYAEGRVR